MPHRFQLVIFASLARFRLLLKISFLQVPEFLRRIPVGDHGRIAAELFDIVEYNGIEVVCTVFPHFRLC